MVADQPQTPSAQGSEEKLTYEKIFANYALNIPAEFNIGYHVSDRHAEFNSPDGIAIIHVKEDDSEEFVTFAQLRARSNQLANLLARHGVERGDRVGILLPQAPETAYGHIAAFKMGAISVPLFKLFGVEALQYRLGDSGAKVVITDRDGATKLQGIRDQLPDLKEIFVIDQAVEGCISLHEAMAKESEDFTVVRTKIEDPALIIYTSGTTGQPKGALHAHRVLLGHLPGVEISHDFFPQAGDIFWTPADWAWIGGLLDVLLPSLFHGVPVVARRFEKFTAEAALELMERQRIRNVFLPPTALKMIKASLSTQPSKWATTLRSIASGGETLGAEMIDWGRQTWGLTINEFYGQTECNLIVSSCAALMPAKPGYMGRPVPSHTIAIVDDEGEPVPFGELGNIAVRKDSPTMFLGYWNNPEATAKKFVGDFMLTGDKGFMERDYWIKFVGRDDDVITSSGYRIGPGEIEDCLIAHPAVEMVGVVGKPDPDRTEIVKAYIKLTPDFEPSVELAQEIKAYVKERLAAHEYPREVAFVEELPLTTTGKIIRRELRARAEAEG